VYEPHGLNRVGVNDFLVGIPFGIIVAAVMDQLHLLEDGGLRKREVIAGVGLVVDGFGLTFPDSPAPSSNILISFLAIILSRLS